MSRAVPSNQRSSSSGSSVSCLLSPFDTMSGEQVRQMRPHSFSSNERWSPCTIGRSSGPRFCAGFGNGVLLGYLMYKSGLVPRGLAMLGLIGGPLIFASGIAILFGAFKDGSGVANLLALPEIVWEASLGVYLIVKGFKPSPILAGPSTPA